MDAGFPSRVNYAVARIAQALHKRSATLADIARAVAEAGGELLGDSSWSQILNLKQKTGVENWLAFARAAGVRIGWLLANEGEPPPGYVEPPVARVEPAPRRRDAGRGKRTG